VNWQTTAFLILVAFQLAGTVVFIALYVPSSDWRSSPVGRHLTYWAATAAALDLSWLLLLVVRWPWLVYVLLVVQATVGLLTWQRVRLVWRAQRRTDIDRTNS
jgi:hypothetical protein